MNITFSGVTPVQTSQPQFGALTKEQKKAAREEILEFCVHNLNDAKKITKGTLKYNSTYSASSIAANTIITSAATLLANDLDLIV